MNENKNIYETDNLPLAAWLLIKGHKVLEVVRAGHRVSWTFRETDALNDDAYTFTEGTPEGNVRAFDEARQLLYRSIERPEALTLRTS